MKKIVFFIVVLSSFAAQADQPYEDGFDKPMFGDPKAFNAITNYRTCIIDHVNLDDYTSSSESGAIIEKLVSKCALQENAWVIQCVADNSPSDSDEDKYIPVSLTKNYCVYEAYIAAQQKHFMLNAIKATQ